MDQIELFEQWWESEGQYCMSGGGSYEKPFAYNAWMASRRLSPTAEEVQWRNIKTAVKAIADHSFGNPPDPKWEVAHLCVTQSLTAKDGLRDVKLEPLPRC